MLTDKKRQATLSTKGLYPALLILTILSFLQWSPPGFYTWLESFRWYLMLGIAGFLFILQSRYLSFSNTRFYILFSFLSWAGVLLSLLRTYHADDTLYIAVSMAIPFVLGLVLIPSFSHVQGRVAWIIALWAAAILWALRILQLWLTLGENIRLELVGRGVDHNMIALCLASAATASMVAALHGDIVISQPLKKVTRLVGYVSSVVFLICSFLTYSRSGFIIAILGVVFALLTLALSKKTKTFFRIIFLLVFGIGVLIPSVQSTNPIWFGKFSELSRISNNDTSVFVRVVLIRKALQIIKENPIVGVGPGAFRSVQDSLLGQQNDYLPHNTYLGAWAEQGILGLLSYVIWIALWINLIVKNWNDFDISQRVLMSAFVPFFFMLAFLDINGLLNIILLAFFSSILSEKQPIADRNIARLSLQRPYKFQGRM